MSWRNTTILFVLAVLAVSLAWWTSPDDAAAQRGARATATLPGIERMPIEDVQRIEFAWRDGRTMTFEREQRAWMQTEPFRYPLDGYRMRQLITAAQEVEVLDRIDPGAFSEEFTPAGLGFDPHELRVRYVWDDGEAEYALGRRGIAGRAYLRAANDEAVLVTSQHLHERLLAQRPETWRDRTLFRDVSIELDRIIREEGSSRIVMERDRRDWLIREPVTTRADREGIERYVNAIAGARAGGFILDHPSDLARFGLHAPVGRLRIVGSRVAPGEGERADGDEAEPERVAFEQALLVGSTAGGGTQDRFAMLEGSPVVIRLPARALAGLFMPLSELVDPTATGVPAADVRSLQVNGPEGTFLLQREMTRWIAPDHNDRRVTAEDVAELLEQLTEHRAPEMVVSEYPQELHVATITLFGYDRRPLDTVRVAYDPEIRRWALENGDNILRVQASGYEIKLTPGEFGLPGE